MKFCTYDEKLLPKQQTEWAAGYDICSAVWYVVRPNEIKLIKTWVKMVLDEWTVAFVCLRSSMPLKRWLIIPNGIWVIDSDYRWEVWIEVMNVTSEDIVIEKWDRVWQIVVQTIPNLELETTISENTFNFFDEVYPTDRGEWGFWSTWK